MQFGVNVDTRNFEQTLSGWEKKQLPFATARALTQTGQVVQRSLKGTMALSFDRPTPYTLNSVYLKPATKTNLVCTVELKNMAQKGTSPSTFLAPQVFGGTRGPKRSEVLLRSKGVLPSGMFWVPGKAAKLDRYGNISRGLLQQILSATKSFNVAGSSQNRTANSFDRSKTKLELFVGKPAGGRLPLGIYQRVYQGKGLEEKLFPLLIFVTHANYKVRLPITQIAQDVYAVQFGPIFERSLRDALVLQPFVAAA